MDDEKGKWIRSGAITIVLAVAFAFMVYWGWERQNEAEDFRQENILLDEQFSEFRQQTSARTDQFLVYMEAQTQEIKQLTAEAATFRAQLENAGVSPLDVATRPTISFLPEGEVSQ